MRFIDETIGFVYRIIYPTQRRVYTPPTELATFASVPDTLTGRTPGFLWKRRILAGFGGNIFFRLHPFLKPTLQYSPLTAHFKGRNLAVLDHSVKGTFGNLEDTGGLAERQKLNAGFGFFHRQGCS